MNHGNDLKEKRIEKGWAVMMGVGVEAEYARELIYSGCNNR